MKEQNIVDQAPVAKTISEHIKYDFFDFFLVKPLDPIKVTKKFSKPVGNGVLTKDENNVEAEDFDKVETEIKEVDSDFMTGIVLKAPMYYANSEDTLGVNEARINIGDKILYKASSGLWFDLVKDSKLLRRYEIIGIIK